MAGASARARWRRRPCAPRARARQAASLAVAVTDAFAGGVSSARAPRRAACLSAHIAWRRLGIARSSGRGPRRGGSGDDGAPSGPRPRLGRVATAPPSETSPGWGLALGRGTRGRGLRRGGRRRDGDGAAAAIFPRRGLFAAWRRGFAEPENDHPGDRVHPGRNRAVVGCGLRVQSAVRRRLVTGASAAPRRSSALARRQALLFVEVMINRHSALLPRDMNLRSPALRQIRTFIDSVAPSSLPTARTSWARWRTTSAHTSGAWSPGTCVGRTA